jgi:hypothetical protein
MYIKELESESLDWIQVVPDWMQWEPLVSTIIRLRVKYKV